MHVRASHASLLLAVAWLLPSPSMAQLPSGQEEVIGHLSENVNLLNTQYAIDSAARHIGWIDADRRAAGSVVADGKSGPAYDAVHAPTWSGDGSRFAYLARQGKKWGLVVDGKLQPKSHDDLGLAFFSRDGKRFAYAYREGKEWRFVLDGEPVGGVYSAVGTAMISGDFKHFVFVAEKKDVGWIVVLDGKEITRPDGKGWCQIGSLAFSPDSSRFAFVGLERKSWPSRLIATVMVDGQATGSFDGENLGTSTPIGCGYLGSFVPDTHGVTYLLWKPDGSDVVFGARRKNNEVVLMNAGQPGQVFDSIIAGPVFSPDGKRIAYIAWNDNRIIEVVDGKRVRDFPAERGLNFIHYLRFTPDGERLAYVVGRGGGLFGMGTTRRARRRLVINGADGPTFDVTGLTDVTFTADGSSHVYVVHDVAGDKDAIVFNGVSGPATLNIIANTLRLNGNTLTYFARRDRAVVRVTHTLP